MFNRNLMPDSGMCTGLITQEKKNENKIERKPKCIDENLYIIYFA